MNCSIWQPDYEATSIGQSPGQPSKFDVVGTMDCRESGLK
jgi:hypothetical protein